LDQLKTKVANQQLDKLTGRKFSDGTVVSEKLEDLERPQLRTLADSLRNKFGSAVVVLASVNDSDVAIVCAVSKDLTKKVHAGKLVNEVATAIGGKGGGRPDMAEGAGKLSDALPAALERVYDEVGALL
jgi:alanyl-tRNA synthetase